MLLNQQFLGGECRDLDLHGVPLMLIWTASLRLAHELERKRRRLLRRRRLAVRKTIRNLSSKVAFSRLVPQEASTMKSHLGRGAFVRTGFVGLALGLMAAGCQQQI